MRITPCWRVPAACAWLAFVAGCSDDGPKMKPVFPVKGTVTHRGQPAAGVQLSFSPVAGGFDATHATATSGDGGGFAVSTYRAGDGAPAGQYTVTAYWPDNRPAAKKIKAAAGEELAPDRLGGAYSNPKTTTLRATVHERAGNDITIDIP